MKVICYRNDNNNIKIHACFICCSTLGITFFHPAHECRLIKIIDQYASPAGSAGPADGPSEKRPRTEHMITAN